MLGTRRNKTRHRLATPQDLHFLTLFKPSHNLGEMIAQISDRSGLS